MADYSPRLKELYNKELKVKLQKALGLKNINEVPELTKVIVASNLADRKSVV